MLLQPDNTLAGRIELVLQPAQLIDELMQGKVLLPTVLLHAAQQLYGCRQREIGVEQVVLNAVDDVHRQVAV